MRAAMADGVMPCSTSVTSSALIIVDSFAVGMRPMIDRKAMPPRSILPIRSLVRS